MVWNYGWDLYRAGDAAAALEQWRTLMTARSVTRRGCHRRRAGAVDAWPQGRGGAVVRRRGAHRAEPVEWQRRLCRNCCRTGRKPSARRWPRCRPPGRRIRRAGPDPTRRMAGRRRAAPIAGRPDRRRRPPPGRARAVRARVAAALPRRGRAPAGTPRATARRASARTAASGWRCPH